MTGVAQKKMGAGTIVLVGGERFGGDTRYDCSKNRGWFIMGTRKAQRVNVNSGLNH